MVKAYLRYEEGAAFGLVASGEARVCFDNSGKLLLAGALEQFLVWNVKQGRCVNLLVPSAGARPLVTAIATAPSSASLVAVGYKDGTIRVWDIVKGTCEMVLTGHKGAVTALAYNKTGSLLASGSTDTDIIVWDAVAETGLYRLKGHRDQVTDLVFLERSKKLVSGCKDTHVRVWDLDTQSCVQRIVSHRSAVWALDVDPSERFVVTGSADAEIRVFGVVNDEGAQKEVHAVVEDMEHADDSNDGSKVGPRSKWDILVPMGSIARQSADRVSTLKFNPSGTLLGCQVAGKSIEIFRVLGESEAAKKAKRREKRRREKAAKAGKGEATDGQGFGGEGEQEGNASSMAGNISAADEFQRLQLVRLKQKITSFSFCPAEAKKGTLGTIGIAVYNNSLEVQELQEESSSRVHSIELPGHRSDVRMAALSSDSTTLMTASHNAVKIWNPRSGVCLRTVESGYGLCGAVVPGNRQAILGTKAGGIEIFDIAGAERTQVLEAHSGAVWSLAPMPDGSGFVSGSADKNVKFWDYELVQGDDKVGSKQLSIRNTRTLQMADDVLCVRLSPDARYIAVALLDSTIKIFFTDTLKFFVSLYGHKLPVLSMDISSDGALLASGSGDKNVKIWGMDFGDCRKSLFAHGDSVTAVQFVPKTHYMFSAGKDGVVKYWDADKFELLLTLEGHHAAAWCLAVSPHGDFLVTGSQDRSIRRLDRTEEPFFIEEEREKRLETMFEATDNTRDDGVDQGVEVGSKRTQETLSAADSIIEAVDMADSEIERLRVHKKSTNGKEDGFQANVLMLGLSPSDYVLRSISSVRPSDLEQALLSLPFNDALKLLSYTQGWIASGSQVELACRVVVMLVRIHHSQLTATSSARATLTGLHPVIHGGVQKLKDVLGYNSAGMALVQSMLAMRSDAMFQDAGQKVLDIRKKLAERREESRPRKRQKKPNQAAKQ
ncbi:uncharacterized protein [Physcomitrium patens]|uniref:Small-subunit processome Utp12 domain-containing protein n=1 Tax=Physcomitrium patens TaxID=3218 RepID=A0A2K1IG24_PHYPA|nr:WD repeat-containing protein 3-like [Physcomitrium patens]XP_024364382.1 WD repeat-containing protein 3-like [Physcomitrium patens]PNR28231.1 hypothetical protein PHYPA_028823 [Physcomitrium patens]PNR28233.1 hypothetical protein PHYPA_028825 [Physcomitrium patens]|eukprot:XP_024364353.1 WD repeat-containing protein 3-like [Physcomitrella patens]